MRIRLTLTPLCLLTAFALAAPLALGAPAGDEYLPKVPKKAGKQVTADDKKGEGATVLAPASRGSGGPPGSGSPGSKKDKGAKSETASSTPLAQVSASDDDSGGLLNTLLDPVVLLLIAGVATAAVGMTMRRRTALAGHPDGEGATRDLGSKPPTPDGEIIGREPPS